MVEWLSVSPSNSSLAEAISVVYLVFNPDSRIMSSAMTGSNVGISASHKANNWEPVSCSRAVRNGWLTRTRLMLMSSSVSFGCNWSTSSWACLACSSVVSWQKRRLTSASHVLVSRRSWSHCCMAKRMSSTLLEDSIWLRSSVRLEVTRSMLGAGCWISENWIMKIGFKWVKQ